MNIVMPLPQIGGTNVELTASLSCLERDAVAMVSISQSLLYLYYIALDVTG